MTSEGRRMPRKTATQAERVLVYAADGGADGITRLGAALHVGCFELAARIGELERDGCVFARERVGMPSRYGGRTTVTRYVLRYAPPVLVAHAREHIRADAIAQDTE